MASAKATLIYKCSSCSGHGLLQQALRCDLQLCSSSTAVSPRSCSCLHAAAAVGDGKQISPAAKSGNLWISTLPVLAPETLSDVAQGQRQWNPSVPHSDSFGGCLVTLGCPPAAITVWTRPEEVFWQTPLTTHLAKARTTPFLLRNGLPVSPQLVITLAKCSPSHGKELPSETPDLGTHSRAAIAAL